MISQRSGTKRQVREGRERYLDYVEALRHTARDQIASQRAEQAWRHPRTDELLDICPRRHPAVGASPVARRLPRPSGWAPARCRWPSGLTLDADTGPLNDFDPVCLQAAAGAAAALLRPARPADHARTCASSASSASSAGPRTAGALATNLVLQLAALHAPARRRARRSYAPTTPRAAWDWVKWLPHSQSPNALDGDLPARRVTSDVPAMTELLAADLEARLDRRAAHARRARPRRLRTSW